MSKPEPGRGRGRGRGSGRGARAAGGRKQAEDQSRKRKAAAGPAAEVEKHSLKTTRGLFAADLQLMMYGHGDDEHPLQETVNVVEDILVEYVTDVLRKAATDKPTIVAQDLMWVLRKDRAKLDRGKELLAKKKEIDFAKKLVNDATEGFGAADEE